MGFLPITEQGKPVVWQADWPLFYMNDFSRLGLVVASLDAAVATLRADGYEVRQDGQGCQVRIDGQRHLLRVLDSFAARQLDYQFTDLVGCVYQG